MLVLDALERLERARRVDIACLLGHRDTFAQTNPHAFDPKFSAPRTGQISAFDEWQRKRQRAVENAREDFVKHFRIVYGDPLPIWVDIELWDFGMLRSLFKGMRGLDQRAIAQRYGIPSERLLLNWIQVLNHVRNVCAHHGRLWNRSLVFQVEWQRAGEIPELAFEWPRANNIYAVLSIISFLMRTVNPNSSWTLRLNQHMKTFPIMPGIDHTTMGFPPGAAESIR